MTHYASHHRSRQIVRLLWVGGVMVVILYVIGFYRFFVSPTGFRWRALYGDEKHPLGYEIRGVDISHYQGDIDWQQLRAAAVADCPIRFVMVKATEGSSRLDENFIENFAQAYDHGFLRGAYHYYGSHSSATVQAQFFIENVPLCSGDLPPILDIEKKPKRQSIDDFQRDILTWLTLVEEAYHAKPIIYASKKFKEQYLTDSAFNDYPFWIAHYYVNEMAYNGAWKFWQYTDVGHVPGIRGYVDLNVYNGSYYDMQQLCLP